MAAKKPKAPKKFKQARSAAKADAKAAFNGKVQARRKDITAKLTAEDKQVLSEVSKESRAGIITGPDGKTINVKPTETAQERYNRESVQAREKFRAQMREEGLYPPEKGAKPSTVKSAETVAPAKPKKTKVTKPKATKPVVDRVAKPSAKPATKGYAAGKKLNKVGQARYDELIKQGVKPKSAMNKALFAQEKAGKTTATTETPTKPKVNKPKVSKPGAGIAEGGELKTADQVKTYKEAVASGKSKGEAMRLAQGKTSTAVTKATGTDVAVRPKGTVVAKGKEVATTESKVAGAAAKGSRLKRFVKGGAVLGAVTATLDSKNLLKSAQDRAQAEVDLYALKHKGKNPGAVDRAKMAVGTLPTAGKQVLNYFSGGLLGENASVSTKKKQAELAAYKKKLADAAAKKAAAANKGLRYGPNGESLVPGTAAYKNAAGSSRPVTKNGTVYVYPGTNPKNQNPSSNSTSGAGGSGGAGGSTITATPGSTYVVKSGDTLSAIAKASGLSLKEIRAANPRLMTVPKYKQGNMIWSGTKVKIPTIQK
jgi:LysM repeat protein